MTASDYLAVFSLSNQPKVSGRGPQLCAFRGFLAELIAFCFSVS